MTDARSLVHQPRTHRRARPYKEEFLLRHFGQPRLKSVRRNARWASIGAYETAGSNVVGVGFGIKEAHGSGISATEALRVYVRRKLPLKKVRKARRIPREINGLPTDVIEVGEIQAAGRPAMGGFSGGSASNYPGTLGCLTRSRAHPANLYILSCFHVLASLSSPHEGDNIYEPAVLDGGYDPIGQLQYWRNLEPSGNLVDCAIARIITQGTFLPDLRDLGQPNPLPLPAQSLQAVKKSGRNDPHVTFGVIKDVSADISVTYSPQFCCGFVQQIAVQGVGGAFAAGGDSGALVVDAGTLRPVGLLFAVSAGLTFANPIGAVLDGLGVDIV